MSRFITWLYFAACLGSVSGTAPGCSNRKEVEGREFVALRTQLVRISQTPTDKLDPEIGRLADMDISTQRVAECRDSCLEAYEAIADAQRTSAMAESIISGLTDAGTDDGAPAPTDDVADRMQKATELLEISEEKLDAARKAKDECHEKLAALEAEGLDRNR